MSDSLQPHGLLPARLLCPWDSPGQNPAVGSHSLLQGIFPTQGSQTQVFCTAGGFFTIWATREALEGKDNIKSLHSFSLFSNIENRKRFFIQSKEKWLDIWHEREYCAVLSPHKFWSVGWPVTNVWLICGVLGGRPEKAMAPHSSTLAWKIPWTEEPGRLQSMGSLESDTTEWLHFHFSLSCIGEGNGNPLQCPCLENPRDGWAWRAGAQSQTRLKRLSSSSSSSSRGETYKVQKPSLPKLDPDSSSPLSHGLTLSALTYVLDSSKLRPNLTPVVFVVMSLTVSHLMCVSWFSPRNSVVPQEGC